MFEVDILFTAKRYCIEGTHADQGEGPETDWLKRCLGVFLDRITPETNEIGDCCVVVAKEH